MSEIYTVIVGILGILAVSGLFVGVTNDAVNFLNSAIGSKAASMKVILTVASVGIIIGVVTSSGMMEVARSGMFNPGLFTFHEVMMLYLGVMFLMATVLIIYYKQITEGYEDQDRFQILMKVGMTQKEVRQAINSQVMTVFFLPLVAAGIHTAFAFPMIEKMVQLLAFSDRKFLILVTVCSYLVFALFYIIVYMVTSKQYYKIVSGKQEESLFS